MGNFPQPGIDAVTFEVYVGLDGDPHVVRINDIFTDPELANTAAHEAVKRMHGFYGVAHVVRTERQITATYTNR